MDDDWLDEWRNDVKTVSLCPTEFYRGADITGRQDTPIASKEKSQTRLMPRNDGKNSQYVKRYGGGDDCGSNGYESLWRRMRRRREPFEVSHYVIKVAQFVFPNA